MRKLFYFIACFLFASLLLLPTMTAVAVTTSFNASQDTFIASDDPDSSFLSEPFFFVGFDDDIFGLGVQRALVYFNIALPPQQQVTSSKLRLYYNSDESINPGQVLIINTHLITSNSWLTSAPTWSNLGGGIFDNSTVSSLNVGGETNGYYEWDVTNIVRNWVQNGVPNNGFLLKAQDESIAADRAFQSLASSGGKPILEINHETIQPPAPPTPPAAPAVNNPAPPAPVATPPAPKKVQKKKVVTGFHKKKCKNKKFHASHCKNTANKKQSKKNKAFHKKKCSKVITTSASLRTDLLFKIKR